MCEKPMNVKRFLNDFDILDYKRPIGKASDWRTSTYRSHFYLNDANMSSNLPVKLKPSKEYSSDYKLEQSRISDYKDNFLWPPHETGLLRNPKMGFKQQFIKPFDERKLKFLKRPMRPATSSAHDDYQWRTPLPELRPDPMKCPTEIKITPVSINRGQPGYSKLLDPSATTYNLSYIGLTPEQVDKSIARKDNITFWNWSKMHQPILRVWPGADGQLCDKYPSKDCPKKFNCHSQVKHVPHTGLTTEVRDNYLAPLARTNEPVCDTTQIRNAEVFVKVDPSPKETDYRLLTSGERTQKYV